MKAHPHTWEIMRVIARQWCTHCGLVRLRNQRSELAARDRCHWWDD